MKDFENTLKQSANSKADLKARIASLSELAGKAKSDTVREMYESQIEELAPILKEMENSETKDLDLNIPYRTALDKASLLLKHPYKYWEDIDVLEKQRMFFFIFNEKLPYNKKDGYRTNKSPMAVSLFEEFACTNPLDVEMGSNELPCKG